MDIQKMMKQTTGLKRRSLNGKKPTIQGIIESDVENSRYMKRIVKIKIQNYRGIDDLEFKPKMINIFVGRNNAGKSYVLNAIFLNLLGLFEYRKRSANLATNISNILVKPLKDELFYDHQEGRDINDWQNRRYQSILPINLIGGTNQINIALLTSSNFWAVAARYYYIFQSAVNLLHPDISKPDLRRITKFPAFFEHWNELPFFQLEIGSIVRRLGDLFQERDVVNIAEIIKLLQSCGFGKKYLSKLQNRLIIIDSDMASPGPLLEKFTQLTRQVEDLNIDDFAQWKKWASTAGNLQINQ